MKKLKKSVAVVAALLLMSSGLNAYNIESPRCFELADSAATAIGDIYGLSHLEEYNLFEQLYDDCVEFEEL